MTASAGPGGCRPRPGQPETFPYLANGKITKEAIMADEKLIIPDGKLIIPEIRHMNGLAIALALLLEEAAELPDPETVTIFGILDGYVHDDFMLQFPPVPESQWALVLWALCFGGVITAKTKECETGPQMWVDVKFTYRDAVRVHAFAHIPLPQTEAITSTDYDSEPYPVTPF
jgi:hypothetical protein